MENVCWQGECFLHFPPESERNRAVTGTLDKEAWNASPTLFRRHDRCLKWRGGLWSQARRGKGFVLRRAISVEGVVEHLAADTQGLEPAGRMFVLSRL